MSYWLGDTHLVLNGEVNWDSAYSYYLKDQPDWEGGASKLSVEYFFKISSKFKLPSI